MDSNIKTIMHSAYNTPAEPLYTGLDMIFNNKYRTILGNDLTA